MKRLTVMRHAEAGQASSDFDRRLTDYGLIQARNAADQLSDLIKPELLIASSSGRTRETAGFLIVEFQLEPSSCKFDERIYEASTEDLKAVIAELPDSCSDIIMVGHNPSISSLVTSWTDTYAGFSTGCSAVLEIEADSWAEAVYKPAAIARKVLPKV